MQRFDMTSLRTKTLGLLTCAVLLLLLGWQSNLTSSHSEQSFVVATQSVIDVSTDGLDSNDIDPVLLQSLLLFDELAQWGELTLSQLRAPASHTFIPQSRAPPVFL